MPADSYAKKLQDCQADLASMREDRDRFLPVNDELKEARAIIESLTNKLAQYGNTNIAMRQLKDEIARLSGENQLLSKRVNTLSKLQSSYDNILKDINDLVKDKECLLPKIRERLARG